MNEDIKLGTDSADDDWIDSAIDSSDWNSTWPFMEDLKSSAGNNVTLDWETSDRITVCTLKHHLEIIYEREHDHKVFGQYYHDEDREYDRKLKKALKRVLRYFGEEVE